ncbi:MAG: 3-isopropylmalate dehydratase [Lentisphaerae bacterium]|nr:3-isopropylmalate dehydratase [Lentisphaerota bacterium]
MSNSPAKKPPTVITGQVYVLGDNIDTDQIIPAQHLNLVPTIPDEYRQLGRLALSGLPPEYPPLVEAGSEKSSYTILIAGRNFGCGSSREHAPLALGAAGIQVIVAESYARIFFRNAIATGVLYPWQAAAPDLNRIFRTADQARLNFDAAFLEQVDTQQRFPLKPLGAAQAVIAAGGLFAHARQTGLIQPRNT